MEEISPKYSSWNPSVPPQLKSGAAAVASLGYGETIPSRTFRLDDPSDQIRQLLPVMAQSSILGIGWGRSLYQMQIFTNLTRPTF